MANNYLVCVRWRRRCDTPHPSKRRIWDAVHFLILLGKRKKKTSLEEQILPITTYSPPWQWFRASSSSARAIPQRRSWTSLFKDIHVSPGPLRKRHWPIIVMSSPQDRAVLPSGAFRERQCHPPVRLWCRRRTTPPPSLLDTRPQEKKHQYNILVRTTRFCFAKMSEAPHQFPRCRDPRPFNWLWKHWIRDCPWPQPSRFLNFSKAWITDALAEMVFNDYESDDERHFHRDI